MQSFPLLISLNYKEKNSDAKSYRKLKNNFKNPGIEAVWYDSNKLNLNSHWSGLV